MKIECPYCLELIDEPDECDEPDVHFEQQCPKCDKIFGFTVDYTKNFYEYLLPCANGEPHDWRPIHGFPTEYYADKRRCYYCSIETTLEQIDKEQQ